MGKVFFGLIVKSCQFTSLRPSSLPDTKKNPRHTTKVQRGIKHMKLFGWDDRVAIHPLFDLGHVGADKAVSASVDHLLILLKGPAEKLVLIE